MDDKLGKAFWAFMGLDAILLLITLSAYFGLSEKSIVTLAAIIISASAGLIGVFWSQSMFNKRHIESQEKMDARQREDHQLEIKKQEKQHEHDWEKEREDKLLEKKEEVIRNINNLELVMNFIVGHATNILNHVHFLSSNVKGGGRVEVAKGMIKEIAELELKRHSIVQEFSILVKLLGMYFPSSKYDEDFNEFFERFRPISTKLKLFLRLVSDDSKYSDILNMRALLKDISDNVDILVEDIETKSEIIVRLPNQYTHLPEQSIPAPKKAA